MIRKKIVSLSENQGQEIKINIKRKTARGFFQITTFEDNGYQISYIPALNITAYGDTKKESTEMLDIMIDDFLEGLFTLSESQITLQLKKLGWIQNPIFKKDFSTTAHVDREGILRNFNLPAETEIESQLVSV